MVDTSLEVDTDSMYVKAFLLTLASRPLGTSDCLSPFTGLMCIFLVPADQDYSGDDLEDGASGPFC